MFLKMKQNLTKIDHKWMNKSLKTIFIKKNIMISKLFAEIWKLDFFYQNKDPGFFFVFLELYLKFTHFSTCFPRLIRPKA